MQTMPSGFELFPNCRQLVLQGLLLELVEIEHEIRLSLLLSLPVFLPCVVDNSIRVFLQIEPITLVILPRTIGLPEPLLRLIRVQIHQSIISFCLTPAILITRHLVITMLQVPFDHIHRFAQSLQGLLFIADLVLHVAVVAIHLVVQEQGRDKTVLQHCQALLNLFNSLIVIPILLMFLGDPALDLRQQHPDIVRFLGDCGVDLQEEILIMFDRRAIVLKYLEDFEVIDVIETVIGLLDELAEDDHVLMPLEGLPQSGKVHLRR